MPNPVSLNKMLDETKAGVPIAEREKIFEAVKQELAKDTDVDPVRARFYRDSLNQSIAEARNYKVSVGIDEPLIPMDIGKIAAGLTGTEYQEPITSPTYEGQYAASTVSSWQDKMATATDFLREIPGTLARVPLELLSVASYGVEGAGIGGKFKVGGLGTGLTEGMPELGDPAENYARSVRAGLNAKVAELSKNDPEMAELADAVMLDFTVGMLLAPLTGGASFAGLGKLDKVAALGKYGASSVGGGQAFMQSFDFAMEKIGEDTELSQEAKTGLVVGSAVAGLIAGVSMEKALNRIMKAPDAAKVAKKIGDAIQADPRLDNIDIQPGQNMDAFNALLENKEVSTELKTIVKQALESEGVEAKAVDEAAQVVEGAKEVPISPAVPPAKEVTDETITSALTQLRDSADNNWRTIWESEHAADASEEAFKAAAAAKNTQEAANLPMPVIKSADSVFKASPESTIERLSIELENTNILRDLAYQSMDDYTRENASISGALSKINNMEGEKVSPTLLEWLDLDAKATKLENDIKVLSGSTGPLAERATVEFPVAKKVKMFAEKLSKRDSEIVGTPEFQGFLSTIKSQAESMLKRPLTEGELALAQNKAVNWVKTTKRIELARKLGKLEDNLLPPGTGFIPVEIPAVSVSAMAKKYPSATSLIRNSLAGDTAMAKGLVSIEGIYKLLKTYNHSIGVGISESAYKARRPITMEMNMLWDDIRDSIAVTSGAEGGVAEAISKMVNSGELNKTVGGKILKTIENNFPNTKLAVNIGADAGGNGIQSTFDALGRLIDVGRNTASAKSFTHEFGHYAFMYELSAAERMAFFDDMRVFTRNTDNWRRVYPEADILERMIEKADDAGMSRQSLMLRQIYQSPVEAYAQQMMSFIFENALPRSKTLEAFASGISAIKKLIVSSDLVDTVGGVPESFRKFHLKLAWNPDIRPMIHQIKEANAPVDVEAAARSTGLLPDNIEDLKAYADDIQQQLEAKYSTQEVMEQTDSFIAERRMEEDADAYLLGDTFSVEEIAEPMVQMVARMSVEDLPRFIEMHAIRLLADMEKGLGDPVALQTAMRRYGSLLSIDNRDALLDRLMMGRGKPVVSKFGAGGETDIQTGGIASEYASKAEAREHEITQALARGDAEAIEQQKFIANRNKLYRDAYYSKEQQLGRPLTQEEYRQVRQEVSARIADQKPKDFDADRAEARLALRAMQAEYTLLEGFANEALKASGLFEEIPASVIQGLRETDMLVRLSLMDDLTPKNLTQFGSVLARGLLLGMGGVYQDDENGIPTPFGKLSWSIDKVFERGMPLALLIAPGAFGTLKHAYKRGVIEVPRIIAKLTPEQQQLLSKVGRSFRKNWGQRGLLTEGDEMLRQAFLRQQAAIRTDWFELSDILKNSFTSQERQVISMMASNDYWPGWKDLKAVSDPRVKVAAKIVRSMYDSVSEKLMASGVERDAIGGIENYMNRLYLYKAQPFRKFQGFYNPVKGFNKKYLIERGLVHDVGKTTEYSALGDGIMDSQAGLKILLKDIPQDIDAQKSLRVNSYTYSTDGSGNPVTEQRVYAVAGSQLDADMQKLDRFTKDSIDWKIQKAGKRKILLRRDYTFAERNMMGETMDASAKTAIFGKTIAEDLAKTELFDNLARDYDRVLDAGVLKARKGITTEQAELELSSLIQNEGWKRISNKELARIGSPAFGSLAGKVVSPGVYDLLQATGINRGLVQQILDKAPEWARLSHTGGLTAWKLGKTAVSIGTHTANFVSNAIIAGLFGHNPVSILADGARMLQVRNIDNKVNQLIKAGKMKEAGELNERLISDPKLSEVYRFYKEAKDAQIGDSTLISGDVNLKEFLAEAEVVERISGTRAPNDLSNMTAAAELVEKHVAKDLIDSTISGLRSGIKGASRLYETGDLIYKFGLFKQMREQGVATNEALKEVYDIFFDYSSLPAGVRFMRDSGLMPFVSYQYKMLNAFGRLATEHPGKLAAAALIAEGVHYRTMAATYGVENMFAGEEFERSSLPSYRNKRSLGVIRQSIAMRQGEMTDIDQNKISSTRYTNIGNLVPGGDLFSTGSAPSLPEMATSAGSLFAGAASANPVFSSLFAMAYTRDPNLDRELFRGPDLPESIDVQAKKAWATAKYIAQTWMPNTPGLPYTYPTERLMQGMTNAGIIPKPVADYLGYTGYNSVGLPLDAMTQIQNIVGMKTYEQIPEEEIDRNIRRIDRELSLGEQQLKFAAGNPAVSDTEYAEKEAFMDTLIEKQETRINKLTQVSEKALQAKQAILARRAAEGKEVSKLGLAQ